MRHRELAAVRARLPALLALLLALGGCIPEVASESLPGMGAPHPLPVFVSGSWATAASLPFADAGCVQAFAATIYVFGAQYTQIYDTATDTWSFGTPMPTGRGDLTCIALGPYIYVIGGYLTAPPGNNEGLIERYEPATDGWTAMTGAVSPRYAMGSGQVNGLIYIFGGYDVTQEGATESYDPVGDAVTPLLGFSPPLSDIKGAGDGANTIFTFGGFLNTAAPVNTVQLYNTLSNNWSTGTPMSSARWRTTSAVSGGLFYVIGGFDATTTPLANNDQYDATSDSWTPLPDMPTPRAFASAAAYNGHIYVMGGSALGTENEVYTP